MASAAKGNSIHEHADDAALAVEQPLSYSEKLRIANRDAIKALVALAVIVVVWLACGFGLAGLDVRVAGVPLWVVAGLLGTWAAAIIAAVLLARSFRDFDLEDGAAGSSVAGSGAASSGAAGPKGAASSSLRGQSAGASHE